MRWFSVFAVAVLAVVCSCPAAAYDFTVDGIYYSINHTFMGGVSVCACEGKEYQGDIVIPGQVVYNGTTYEVRGIDYEAFNWCKSLRSVKLPNTIRVISEAAFFGCTALTNIELPSSLESIHNHAFCYAGLKSVVLPNSVTFLGDACFGGCPIESIVVEEGSCFDSRDDCNAIIYYDSGMESIELCEGCRTTVIPQSVTHITDYAFKGCKGLETIEIPEGVTYIGDYAFYDCTDLKRIVIPASVEEIDDNAFEGCTSLTEVVIKGHPEMGDDVFKDCPNLRTKPSGKITFRDRSNY